MMTPDQLAELARESDDQAEQFPTGISVELTPGIWLGFLADGRVDLNGGAIVLTPAKARALLHGLRMLDLTSDLVEREREPWSEDPDGWKQGGA